MEGRGLRFASFCFMGPVRTITIALALALAAAGQWPQFGGPNGNFVVEGKGIAETWPAAGPRQLWKRVLGEGYSGVAVESGILYTMYSRATDEVVTALEASTGKTLWEYAYDKSKGPRMDLSNGPGPHATPLILGDRIFTIGIRARMHALDKKTSKPIWQKELYKDFPGSTEFDRGYAISPIAYKNTIIVKLGGPDHAIVALDPKDGSLRWRKHSFGNAPATPVIVQTGGRDISVDTVRLRRGRAGSEQWRSVMGSAA